MSQENNKVNIEQPQPKRKKCCNCCKSDNKNKNTWLLYLEDDVRPINVDKNDTLNILYNIPTDAELIRPYIGKNEKINTINFGPFRIDLNIHALELNKNNFTLTFILDEYVQDKWNYGYTQKKLHEYNIIKNFNAFKGYDETVEEIETVIADMNKFNNSN
jgi:hypothetical protein